MKKTILLTLITIILSSCDFKTKKNNINNDKVTIIEKDTIISIKSNPKKGFNFEYLTDNRLITVF